MKQSEKGFKGLILKSSLSLDNWLQDLPEHFKVSHAGCDISACITTNHHISLSRVFQFSEKFQEVKEAAKLAKDKSQDKVETLSNHSEVNFLSLPSEIQI